MRILAIRGQNLASLETFDLDLAALEADGGLFAITGPTGAGKSTILDALCLALYDRTPRLDGRSTLKVGRGPDDPNYLSHTDVRTILRRGTAEGFAEVDFVGQDGGHYTARWSVRRAYGNRQKRLQPQTLSLSDLEGQIKHGATKTETLKIIEEKVGLSFDQFRRSVLLAQGEFDAFLRAPVEDRGALLERMTGTEIYRQLSVGARVKKKQAEQALAELNATVAGRPVLPAEARAALGTQLTQTQAWLEAVHTRQETTRKNLNWYAQLHALEAKLTAAGEAEAVAAAHHEAAEPRRAALAAVRAVEPLRPRLEAVDRGQLRLKDARSARERHHAAVAVAETRLSERSAIERSAQAQLGAAREAEQRQSPILQEARRVDVALAEAERRCQGVTAQAEKAQATAASAEADRVAANTQIRRLEGEHEVAAAWLTAQPAVNLLYDQWDRWQTDLTRWVGTRRRETQARAQVEADTTALAVAAARLPEARRQVEQRDALWRAAHQAQERAREAVEAQPAHGANAAWRHWTDARESLSKLGHLADQLQTAHAEGEKARGRAQAAHGKAMFFRMAVETEGTELATRKAHLVEARRSLELTRSVLDLAGHRAQLRPGDHCPLCGATEHPGVAASSAVSDAQGGRVRELEREVTETERAIATAKAQAAASDSQAEQAEGDVRLREQHLSTLRDQWSMARMELGDTELPERFEDSRTGTLLESRRDEIERGLADARKRMEEAERRTASLDQTGQHEARARAERETAALELVQLDDAQRAAEKSFEIANLAVLREAADRQALEAVLAEALTDADWVRQAEADPPGFLATHTQQALAFRAMGQRLDEAHTALTTARPEVERLAERARQLAATAEQLLGEGKVARMEANALAGQRGSLLGGEAAQVVETRLKTMVTAAQAGWDAAVAAHALAMVAAEGARVGARAAEVAAERAEAEGTEATDALAGALAAMPMEETTARQLLEKPPEWQQAEAAALDALDRVLDRDRALLNQRTHDRDEHTRTQTPAGDEAHAQAQHLQLEAGLRGFQSLRAQIEQQIRDDDRARAARAQVSQALAAAAAEQARWHALDALIGSADGKTFTNFAQSLTLEAVLGHANVHLKDIHRRYQLMRVPGEDLSLQIIDRDMGDEVRSLQSLSGGETFLVSLSLALGLASLSARDLRLESLFIDEGFGSLDVETLDAVIEVLTDLQQTGRQVGIISHVPGLDERIGVQVKVEPQSSGLSRVRLVRGSDPLAH